MTFINKTGLALDANDLIEIEGFLNGEFDLSEELYQKLFDHYCNNGEMPYGVAKARDGDPYEWIAEQLGKQ